MVDTADLSLGSGANAHGSRHSIAPSAVLSVELLLQFIRSAELPQHADRLEGTACGVEQRECVPSRRRCGTTDRTHPSLPSDCPKVGRPCLADSALREPRPPAGSLFRVAEGLFPFRVFISRDLRVRAPVSPSNSQGSFGVPIPGARHASCCDLRVGKAGVSALRGWSVCVGPAESALGRTPAVQGVRSEPMVRLTAYPRWGDARRKVTCVCSAAECFAGSRGPSG